MTTDKLADYITLAVAIHSLALVVVNLTPTPKDNEAMGQAQAAVVKIYRAIELIAGIWSHKAKQ